RPDAAPNLAQDEAALADLDVIITMLPNGAAVRECLLGSADNPALVDRLASNATVIDMSSSSPMDTRALAGILAERNVQLLDAPVSGSVPKAREGTLAIMVGGATDIVERMRPIFMAMG